MFRYSSFLDTLLKAMTHKYIRRVPKGVTKTGKTKYMYFYAGQEGHGQGVAHESELVEGASFAFGEHRKTRYHAHIRKVDGDKVTVKYDDGAKKGQEETMTKKQFQALVHGEHASSIQSAKEKATKQLQDFKAGKEKGVKVKQETIDKLEQRIKNLDELTKKPVETKKMPDKANKEPKKQNSKINTNLSKLPATTLLSTLSKLTDKLLGTQMPRPTTHLMYDIKHNSIATSNGAYMIKVKDIDNQITASPDIQENAVYLDPEKTQQFTETQDRIQLTKDQVIYENAVMANLVLFQSEFILSKDPETLYSSFDLPDALKEAISKLPKGKKDVRSDIIFVHRKGADDVIEVHHVLQDIKTKQITQKTKLATLPAENMKSRASTNMFSFNTENLQKIVPYINNMNLVSSEFKPASFSSTDGKTDALLMPTRVDTIFQREV